MAASLSLPSKQSTAKTSRKKHRTPAANGSTVPQNLPEPETTTATAVSGPLHTVEAANAEELIEAKSIGERIRRLRLKRSMGLVELGRLTGLSASFLSQLETGRVVPTLRNLSRIALVFKKDLYYFFQDQKFNNFKTSRAKDRVRLPLGDKSDPVLISESMSALIADRSLVPCLADFIPGDEKAAFDPHTFNGQEFVYVIDGSLTLSTEHESQTLDAADTAWVDGQTKRHYRPVGGPARALIITCPTKV